MKHLRPTFLLMLPAVLLIFACVVAALGTKDQELFNQGKIAIFDKNWEAARGIFQKITQEYAQSPVAPQAYYFIARCYQFEGKQVDALRAYERFLQLYPKEPFLPGEARNSIVEIAASLMESGDFSYKDRLTAALSDPNKDVRYFAAIRCSRLRDPLITSMAIPVLREIARQESERDLADRARIALLRLDPRGLTPKVEETEKKKGDTRSKAGPADQKMFHLLVYKEGVKQPVVELNLPLSLAQMAVEAMDDSAKAELKKKGVDIENIWESLGRMGTTNILTIRDGENLIKLWIE